MKQRFRLGMLGIAGMLILIAGGSTLNAQRWQDIFGTTSCSEFGARGVEPVAAGGYISAGSSSSPIPGCLSQNVYVVRTDDNGNLLWSFTYDLGGGNSAASCVRECANGDFIVTGTNQNLNVCCCNPDDIFLMRLDPNGGVRWVKSYGSAGAEKAFSVIETTLGNGASTKPGDFVVCGTTTAAGATITNGYIFRTSSGGKLIWDQAYSGLNNQTLVYYDVDEALVNLPGSILACGDAFNGTSLGTLIRVNGNDGTVLDGPIIWPGGNGASARSVKELQVAIPGDVVVTGFTGVGGGTNAYIARFGPATGCPFPLAAAAAQYYTGTTTASSFAQDIQETSVGNVIVTGGAIGYPGGFGSSDVMLIEVDPTTLNYAGIGFNLYGGGAREEGVSVAETNPIFPATPGFIIAGYSNSFNFPDVDMYVVKTDAAGTANPPGCNSANLGDIAIAFTLVPKCYGTTLQSINTWCTPPYTADAQTWGTQLCYTPFRNERGDNPTDGISRAPENNPTDENVIAITDDAAIASYPNPVRKGSTFKLDYKLAHGGHVTVDVVDVSGKTVYTHTGDYPSGTSQIPVNTDGWPNGAYIVKLSADGAAATQRVTVLDK
jgi:hypothetical protein